MVKVMNTNNILLCHKLFVHTLEPQLLLCLQWLSIHYSSLQYQQGLLFHAYKCSHDVCMHTVALLRAHLSLGDVSCLTGHVSILFLGEHLRGGRGLEKLLKTGGERE